jgi:hypothetical protein
VEEQGRARVRGKLAALAAVEVRIEDEAARVVPLHQHHPHRRAARGIGGGEGHRRRVVRLGAPRLGEPLVEQGVGIVSHRSPFAAPRAAAQAPTGTARMLGSFEVSRFRKFQSINLRPLIGNSDQNGLRRRQGRSRGGQAMDSKRGR